MPVPGSAALLDPIYEQINEQMDIHSNWSTANGSINYWSAPKAHGTLYNSNLSQIHKSTITRHHPKNTGILIELLRKRSLCLYFHALQILDSQVFDEL
jgi:hypothetical protein